MREAFADQLDGVVSDLVTLAQMVQQATNRASHSLLTADSHIAEQVIADDRKIDALRDRIEEECFDILARQQPVAGDLRMLVASVRMVSDLERMGDLSVHVAKVAQLRMPELAVPEEMTPIITRMAEVSYAMIGQDAEIIASRDVEAARRLEEADEELDMLRKQSFRIILGDNWNYGVEPAIDLALIGRYYERIGDHAVSIARRVIYLVTGT
jgi:phosphate transport system protein